jgi:exosortase
LKNNKFSELCSHFSVQDQIRIMILFSLVIVLFAPSFMKLMQVWYTDSDYSHGFCVIPISLYMVWLKRHKLAILQKKTSWIGLLILISSLITYLVSYAVRFHTLLYLSIICVVVGIVLFLAGWQVTRVLLLPLLFLVFMIPIPNAYYIMITNPLRLMITGISAWLMGFLGIPVLQDGNLLYLAHYQLEVAEACSGVRSLTSYLMLGFLFAVLSRKTFSKVFIILSTIPFAIAVNIIRVTVTGILANFFGDRVAQGFFHEFTGFLLFLIGFVILFLEYYLIEVRTAEKIV